MLKRHALHAHQDQGGSDEESAFGVSSGSRSDFDDLRKENLIRKSHPEPQLSQATGVLCWCSV